MVGKKRFGYIFKFGSKKILPEKKLGNKIWVEIIFFSEKKCKSNYFFPKKNVSQNIFGAKKNLGQRFFGSKKCCQKRIWVPNEHKFQVWLRSHK